MKWVSFSGELAFLSVGGMAKGIIAIGGSAHGIVAIGGIASAGVISIGMNAVGSVVALGMNAAAPISFSLINGLAVYSAAGVNGWGVWSHAGTNSTGLSGEGGVNTEQSVWPAIVVVLGMVVASSVFRGKRAPRTPDDALPLRRFVRSPDVRESNVRARLVAVSDDALELADGRASLEIRGSEAVALAHALGATSLVKGPLVVARLVREEEVVPGAGEVSYRESPGETKRTVVRCLDIALAAEPESWLPKDQDEIQWVIAWSARVAVVLTIVALAWLGLG